MKSSTLTRPYRRSLDDSSTTIRHWSRSRVVWVRSLNSTYFHTLMLSCHNVIHSSFCEDVNLLHPVEASRSTDGFCHRLLVFVPSLIVGFIAFSHVIADKSQDWLSSLWEMVCLTRMLFHSTNRASGWMSCTWSPQYET